MAQSLFRACKNVIRNGAGSVQNVGGYDVGIEYYTQEDIDENVRKIKFGEVNKCTFGDSDESKVVLVASPEITIPTGFTLTPVSPKKSLVIMCNTLVNNGTISMTGKAPNVLPHEWFIAGQLDGYADNVTIPAYAHNEFIDNSLHSANVTGKYNGSGQFSALTGHKGNNGVARNCGSGGTGAIGIGLGEIHAYYATSGSGYAFGGGAGSGGLTKRAGINETLAQRDARSVNQTYPMRGSNGVSYNDPQYDGAGSGVGNPHGVDFYGGYWNYSYGNGWSANNVAQSTGCGGRIIIFCKSIINSGNIQAKGISTNSNMRITGHNGANGGASGGGALDLFYESLSGEGIFTCDGGQGGSMGNPQILSGAGGNGCITYSDGDMAPLWVMPDIFKPRRKKFTKDNWTYLFGEYVDRLNQEV